ncbi:MAG: NAD-dependent epimerase/dehydratase family protein [Gemmatimonadaceae bacterium]
MTTAIVLGATGLVGSELVKVLLSTPFYSSILLLNRRPSAHSHEKISERIINFDAPELEGISGGHLYCALGTTLRKAGSRSRQFKIDCEYPTDIATRLRNQGVTSMLLVSSVGANRNANNFYLRTKGQLEKNIMGLNFECTVIARPSFLTGSRSESRSGEALATVMLSALSPLMVGALRRYRGIEASEVAARLVREGQAEARGVRIVEFG